jgi:hypothetical protein
MGRIRVRVVLEKLERGQQDAVSKWKSKQIKSRSVIPMPIQRLQSTETITH